MAIDDEIFFPEIALFKERNKQYTKISKSRKRRLFKKAKRRQILEGTGKNIGRPSLESDQPPPPWISDDAEEITCLDPVQSTLLNGKGNEMPVLPTRTSQDGDPQMKMKSASSDSTQGRYCLRPRAGGK